MIRRFRLCSLRFTSRIEGLGIRLQTLCIREWCCSLLSQWNFVSCHVLSLMVVLAIRSRQYVEYSEQLTTYIQPKYIQLPDKGLFLGCQIYMYNNQDHNFHPRFIDARGLRSVTLKSKQWQVGDNITTPPPSPLGNLVLIICADSAPYRGITKYIGGFWSYQGWSNWCLHDETTGVKI